MSGTTISSSSSEWARRLSLINQAESEWSGFLGGRWTALLKSLSLTTTASQAYVDLPSDFSKGALVIPQSNLVIINNESYRLVNASEIASYDSTSKICWIMGNEAVGYKLYIQPTPADAYAITTLFYYTNNLAVDNSNTEISKLTTSTDVTKMSDPYFIIDWVIGELYLVDDEIQQKWSAYKESAKRRLLDMSLIDMGEQGQYVTVPVGADIDGYDVFNSYGSED